MFNKKLHIDGYGRVEVDITNKCIHCHTSIEPIHLFASSLDITKNTFALLMQCPACKKYFLSAFENVQGLGIEVAYDYLEISLDLAIPEEITNSFPRFVEIYTQALKAESYGLNEISGVGVRKALEFLIKDFVIEKLGYNLEEISALSLSNTIKKIESPPINKLATAITWIGNDQTHYERKYENKEVADMKVFLKALMNFISFELSLEKATEFVDSNKKN